MRKLLLLLTTLHLCLIMCGQKVITITFADTDDEVIGDGCTIDDKNIHKYSSRLANALGYPIDEQLEYVSSKFNPSSFDQFVSKIKSTNNDILILYISSHGARPKDEKRPFPWVSFEEIYRSAYAKHTSLRHLPHRTLLTLIDACNVIRPISPKEVKLFGKTYNPQLTDPISGTERAVVKKIFVENNFDLIITSSQIGVTSLSTPSGSVFTNSFIAACNYYFKRTDVDLQVLKTFLQEQTIILTMSLREYILIANISRPWKKDRIIPCGNLKRRILFLRKITPVRSLISLIPWKNHHQ
jgi:hypothetical protein